MVKYSSMTVVSPSGNRLRIGDVDLSWEDVEISYPENMFDTSAESYTVMDFSSNDSGKLYIYLNDPVRLDYIMMSYAPTLDSDEKIFYSYKICFEDGTSYIGYVDIVGVFNGKKYQRISRTINKRVLCVELNLSNPESGTINTYKIYNLFMYKIQPEFASDSPIPYYLIYGYPYYEHSDTTGFYAYYKYISQPVSGNYFLTDPSCSWRGKNFSQSGVNPGDKVRLDKRIIQQGISINIDRKFAVVTNILPEQGKVESLDGTKDYGTIYFYEGEYIAGPDVPQDSTVEITYGTYCTTKPVSTWAYKRGVLTIGVKGLATGDVLHVVPMEADVINNAVRYTVSSSYAYGSISPLKDEEILITKDGMYKFPVEFYGGDINLKAYIEGNSVPVYYAGVYIK